MQEVLLQAAAAAGAEVRRGASVVHVAPGERPTVSVRSGGGGETVRCRLVVGADGRASRVRGWAGFPVARAREWLLTTSVLLRGLHLPDDAVQTVRPAPSGQIVLVVPLGAGFFRVYLCARRDGPSGRLSGARHVPRFVAACVAGGAPPDWFAGAEAAGPLATFDSTDTWAEHPYRDGVALVGDAAAANDPNYGCGLSLTLRDVRVLRDHLIAHGDWSAAGRAYAAEHDHYYGSLRRITEWAADLFYAVGPEADARRAQVQPRLRQAREQGMAPDVIGLGPDGPSDEETFRRLG
jgi:2-polyprenyl-6-methoxyphenol hydroxylase-like FAD-dependent oxidoreductase